MTLWKGAWSRATCVLSWGLDIISFGLWMACGGQNDLKMFSKAGVGRWHSLRADASTEAVNLPSSSLMSEMRRCRMEVSQLLYLVFLDCTEKSCFWPFATLSFGNNNNWAEEDVVVAFWPFSNQGNKYNDNSEDTWECFFIYLSMGSHRIE